MDDKHEHEKEKYRSVWKSERYRIISFGLNAAEKLPLVDIFRNNKVRTILDAGCGSGKLMRKLLEENPGEFEVRGFDIADNCLDPWFDDIKSDILTIGNLWNPADFTTVYDAVLCTDVMEHIPPEHVPMVLQNIHNSSGKFAFFTIGLQPDDYGHNLVGESLHLTVQPPQWWIDALGAAGFRKIQYAATEQDQGRDVWLYVIALP